MNGLIETGYYVWNPTENAPRFRHDTYKAAVTEAERLATNHRGIKFVVLRAIGFAQAEKPATYTSTVYEQDEVPF